MTPSRPSILAVAFLAGGAVLAAPASAASLHDQADFGGTSGRATPGRHRDDFYGRYGPRDWGFGYYGAALRLLRTELP